MTNEPITGLPSDIDKWKGFRRILDIISECAQDEIMNLVEFLNEQAGIIDDDSDEFYEKFEEPVENLIWDRIIANLTP